MPDESLYLKRTPLRILLSSTSVHALPCSHVGPWLNQLARLPPPGSCEFSGMRSLLSPAYMVQQSCSCLWLPIQ